MLAGVLLTTAGMAQLGAALLVTVTQSGADEPGPRALLSSSSGVVIVPILVVGLLFLLAGSSGRALEARRSGALTLAAVAWAGVLTFTSLNPPQAVRIAGSAFLPLGIGIGLGAGLAGRHGASRPWALLGFALVAAAIAALTVVQFVVDY